jgi:hypothetical protein
LKYRKLASTAVTLSDKSIGEERGCLKKIVKFIDHFSWHACCQIAAAEFPALFVNDGEYLKQSTVTRKDENLRGVCGGEVLAIEQQEEIDEKT